MSKKISAFIVEASTWFNFNYFFLYTYIAVGVGICSLFISSYCLFSQSIKRCMLLKNETVIWKLTCLAIPCAHLLRFIWHDEMWCYPNRGWISWYKIQFMLKAELSRSTFISMIVDERSSSTIACLIYACNGKSLLFSAND